MADKRQSNNEKLRKTGFYKKNCSHPKLLFIFRVID
jgi:hypothetical protein